MQYKDAIGEDFLSNAIDYTGPKCVGNNGE
jgi:hypothetical protein